MRLVEEGHKKFARQFPVDPPVAAARSHHKGGKPKDKVVHKPAGVDVAAASAVADVDTVVLPVSIPDVDERGRVNMFGPTSMRGKESPLAAAQREADAQIAHISEQVATEVPQSAVILEPRGEASPGDIVTSMTPAGVEVVPGEGKAARRRRKTQAQAQEKSPVTVSETSSPVVAQEATPLADAHIFAFLEAQQRLLDATVETAASTEPATGGETQAAPEEMVLPKEVMATPEEENITETVQAPKGSEDVYRKIDQLTKEVEELRIQYVKEDIESAMGWKKILGLLRIEKDDKKGEWRTLYEAKTQELQKAEVAMMQGDMAGPDTSLSKQDTREGLKKLLRYYKLDEQMNLINARTQYRAEHQKWSEKISGFISNMGRAYNGLSFGKKMLLSGALIGSSLLIAPASGAAAGAIGGLAVLKRFAASAGIAVGAEAALEKVADNRRESAADRELTRQIARLEGSLAEQDFSLFERMMEAEIADSDTKLQEEKRAQLYRKLGAATVGVVVGSGWLWNVGFDVFGGREAAEGIKEHFTQASPDVNSIPGMTGNPIEMTMPAPQEMPDTETNPAFAHDDGVVFGTDTHTVEQSPQVAVESDTEVEARTGVVERFQNTESDPYAVQSGELLPSTDELVAKILQENPEIAEASVSATDVTDAAIDTTNTVDTENSPATEETPADAPTDTVEHTGPVVIDTVLSDSSVAPEVATVPPAPEIMPPVDPVMPAEGGVTSTDTVSSPAAETFTAAPTDGVERAEALGKDLSALREVTALYEARSEGWYTQIFRVENASLNNDWILNAERIKDTKIIDILKDALRFKEGASAGYVTDLNREQINHFAEFFQSVTKSDIAFDRLAFFKENPNATVADYLQKIASLVKPGKRIGLFTTIQ